MVINLLPEQTVKQLKRDYCYRLLTLGLAMLTIVLTAGAIIELTRGVVLRIQTASWAAGQNEQIDQVDVDLRQSATAAIATTNQQLAILQPLIKSRTTPAELIRELLGTRPTTIKIQSIDYTSTADGPTVTLNGLAGSRSQLVAWIGLIETLPMVARVDSPLSNLVKERDVNFSLQVIFTSSQSTHD